MSRRKPATREVAEAAFAKAKLVQGVVQNQVASFSVQADVSVPYVVEVLAERVQEVVGNFDAQALRVAETVTQQLESEIRAAVMNTAVTAELNTCAAFEGM